MRQFGLLTQFHARAKIIIELKMRCNSSEIKENLDFEIDFYKSIIEEAPEYVDALMLLGEAYTRKGLYKEGLEIDRRITALKPGDPIAHYNLACSYSLLKRKREALKSLRKSIVLGYNDIAHMANDRDLATLHGDRDFSSLMRCLGRRILRKIRKLRF